MLTHLPRHRKNDPLWRRHRIRPTPAFSRFPPVHWASVEGRQRVEFSRSPNRPATPASCVRREKAAHSSGCEPHPANAPAGSNRNSHGGDEMAEALGIARRIPAIKEEHSARGRENPRADRAIVHMARDHNAGGQGEPHAARMGELLFGRRVQQGVSGARRLRGGAGAPVVAPQAQKSGGAGATRGVCRRSTGEDQP
jgi:hypothetical protein